MRVAFLVLATAITHVACSSASTGDKRRGGVNAVAQSNNAVANVANKVPAPNDRAAGASPPPIATAPRIEGPPAGLSSHLAKGSPLELTLIVPKTGAPAAAPLALAAEPWTLLTADGLMRVTCAAGDAEGMGGAFTVAEVKEAPAATGETLKQTLSPCSEFRIEILGAGASTSYQLTVVLFDAAGRARWQGSVILATDPAGKAAADTTLVLNPVTVAVAGGGAADPTGGASPAAAVGDTGVKDLPIAVIGNNLVASQPLSVTITARTLRDGSSVSIDTPVQIAKPGAADTTAPTGLPLPDGGYLLTVEVKDGRGAVAKTSQLVNSFAATKPTLIVNLVSHVPGGPLDLSTALRPLKNVDLWLDLRAESLPPEATDLISCDGSGSGGGGGLGLPSSPLKGITHQMAPAAVRLFGTATATILGQYGAAMSLAPLPAPPMPAGPAGVAWTFEPAGLVQLLPPATTAPASQGFVALAAGTLTITAAYAGFEERWTVQLLPGAPTAFTAAGAPSAVTQPAWTGGSACPAMKVQYADGVTETIPASHPLLKLSSSAPDVLVQTSPGQFLAVGTGAVTLTADFLGLKADLSRFVTPGRQPRFDTALLAKAPLKDVLELAAVLPFTDGVAFGQANRVADVLHLWALQPVLNKRTGALVADVPPAGPLHWSSSDQAVLRVLTDADFPVPSTLRSSAYRDMGLGVGAAVALKPGSATYGLQVGNDTLTQPVVIGGSVATTLEIKLATQLDPLYGDLPFQTFLNYADGTQVDVSKSPLILYDTSALIGVGNWTTDVGRHIDLHDQKTATITAHFGGDLQLASPATATWKP